MRKSNVALRLQPSLLKEVRKIAEQEGVAVNQFINVAVAEKISALRTVEFFADRAHNADVAKAIEILSRAGSDEPPAPGDELPRSSRPGRARKSRQRSRGGH